ncbi:MULTISPECIES: adenylate/guanylate cyclase domain-containing protein [unclassified Achromobacter]|uniref:nucleotide-binding domain-containing protein n=1 Tax=unclassified Achromobacter TaxID=2626865 RepID=UPI000B51DDAE|nr:MULTISPECIES: adenylate/guanylate cyclase domain-containing protein [unclassified Achromobacter]OWT72950.1 hypothetical protein CEY05_24025 [Achromobacter sp. HZ34]OWT74168.1 hypothetical protein CEY04_22860 [Achromobacter sp. HZ28]
MSKEDLFRSSFDYLYEKQSKKSRTITASDSGSLSLESLQKSANAQGGGRHQGFDLALDVGEYAIQAPIRDWFGKAGLNEGSIGAHPDFQWIEGTDETRLHYITTVFIDIKNSTRLSFLYDLEKVRVIKNSILRAASETVRALDGHVHRFMGDALMAYFGGSGQDRESTCMAAVNCAAMLRLLMKEAIVPGLVRQGCDASDIGFRIGIDYGGDDQVLWSSYGYTAVSEVTATSFYVDVAAKLQSMASKDKTMLGHNLVSYLDLSDAFTAIKTELQNGEPVNVPYLRPNYQLADGTTLNYKIHELDIDKFAKILPIPLGMRQSLASGLKSRPGIEFKAFVETKHGLTPYPSVAWCVDKDSELHFEVSIAPHALDGLRAPLNCLWIRKNYGAEAENASMTADERNTFDVQQSTSARGGLPKKYRWSRDASFRGIHTMEVKISDGNGTVVFSDVIGVHIR